MGSRAKKKSSTRIRIPNARDFVRQALKEADSFTDDMKLRHVPTDLVKTLERGGITGKVAKGLDQEAQEELAASYSGLQGGRTAGTKPERIAAAWLNMHGYQFGGDGRNGYNFDMSKDWFFQFPLEGGRGRAGGGAVADIFISKHASATKAGVVVRVNGDYWHHLPGMEAHDEAQKIRLVGKGFKVTDISDHEVLQPGVLDGFFTNILGAGNAFH
jgi:hypothetical protein